MTFDTSLFVSKRAEEKKDEEDENDAMGRHLTELTVGVEDQESDVVVDDDDGTKAGRSIGLNNGE